MRGSGCPRPIVPRWDVAFRIGVAVKVKREDASIAQLDPAGLILITDDCGPSDQLLKQIEDQLSLKDEITGVRQHVAVGQLLGGSVRPCSPPFYRSDRR